MILRELIEPPVHVFHTIDCRALVYGPVRGLCIIDEIPPSFLAADFAFQRFNHESVRKTSRLLRQKGNSSLELGWKLEGRCDAHVVNPRH